MPYNFHLDLDVVSFILLGSGKYITVNVDLTLCLECSDLEIVWSFWNSGFGLGPLLLCYWNNHLTYHDSELWSSGLGNFLATHDHQEWFCLFWVVRALVCGTLLTHMPWCILGWRPKEDPLYGSGAFYLWHALYCCALSVDSSWCGLPWSLQLRKPQGSIWIPLACVGDGNTPWPTIESALVSS